MQKLEPFRHFDKKKILLFFSYLLCVHHTGRFIICSGVTKIYDRKTVGHVFTKPVQIEGTSQKLFSQKVVFHRSSHFCR
jgi:hypothetical protein